MSPITVIFYALVLLILFIGILAFFFLDWSEDEEFDPGEDWDEENPDEEMDEDWYDPEPEIAVDLIRSPAYGPETFEFTSMALRLTQPHLFSDTWYEDSRREFSRLMAIEWEKIARFRQEMGLAA
jgi:hypothetical protein